MSCFSCFSSGEKRNSMKRPSSRSSTRSSSRKEQAPPSPARAPAPESTPAPASASVSKSSRAHENPNQGSSAEAAETEKEDDVNNGNIAAQTFTFRELATATRNFRSDCLLGEGGFGRVYKGRLSTGQLVAVKQLDRSGLQGNKEFLVEVLMLSLLHQENLVNLIGYCADGDQRLLVYEYLALGSLEDHLLDVSPPDQRPLSWNIRMKIAHGAAKGLEYLHEKANPPVIYRDLKSSNILLDEDYNPKLSDFGLAKLNPVGENAHVTSGVMGTYGYCAPEYARSGQLTPKSDVYSFGVVLLELVTGRRAIDTTKSPSEQNLVNWAQPLFKDPRRFSELADPLLQGEEYPENSLNQAVAVAAMCLQEEAAGRPFMTDVVTALGFLTAVPSGPQGSPSQLGRPSAASQSQQDEQSDADRQRAVAEAIQWGSNSRNKQRHQQDANDPLETESLL